MSSPLEDPKWLAAALLAYEADEPHVDLPDCKIDTVQYYPPIEPDELERWRHADHLGDCTNQPCPCVRCAGEMAYHKAKWVIQKATE